MKFIVAILSVILVSWLIFEVLSPDKYIGFFYPDSANLSYDIMSEAVFTELWECRVWAQKMALEHADEVLNHENGYDYECGKNCKITGSKPYLCEETFK